MITKNNDLFFILSNVTNIVYKYFGSIVNMPKLDIVKLKQIFSTLSNEKRLKVIELCSQKERTITELSKLLRLNYSITVEYTSMLAKVGLVKKRRNEDKTVNVKSLVKINNEGEIKKI